jgi:predicted nucleic acid-binding protein
MIVVADTSPIANLLLIGQLDLLAHVYGRVIIPEAVNKEILALARFGYDIQSFTDAIWIETIPIAEEVFGDFFAADLDKGEAEALCLARELDADWLLIDERKGTAIAKSIGLQTIGVLGILLSAKRRGQVKAVMPLVHDLIEKAGFWLSKEVLVRIAAEANE